MMERDHETERERRDWHRLLLRSYACVASLSGIFMASAHASVVGMIALGVLGGLMVMGAGRGADEYPECGILTNPASVPSNIVLLTISLYGLLVAAGAAETAT